LNVVTGMTKLGITAGHEAVISCFPLLVWICIWQCLEWLNSNS